MKRLREPVESGGCRKPNMRQAASAYDDFTDLDDRGVIGIVWDVCHDLLGMTAIGPGHPHDRG